MNESMNKMDGCLVAQLLSWMDEEGGREDETINQAVAEPLGGKSFDVSVRLAGGVERKPIME